MSFVEFLGFVISLAAMIFLSTKRFLEERKRRLNPEAYADEEEKEEEKLQAFLKSMNIDTEDEKEFQPPRIQKKQFKNKPPQQTIQKSDYSRSAPPIRSVNQQSANQQLGNYGRENASEKKRSLAAEEANYSLKHGIKPAESYEVIRLNNKTEVSSVLKSLKSPKEMLIIKEIFDKPLSMRDPDERR